MPSLPQNHFRNDRRRLRRSYLELLFVGFGSLCLAGLATGLWLSRNPNFQWPWSKDSLPVTLQIPEPTFCTMVDPLIASRAHPGIVRADGQFPPHDSAATSKFPGGSTSTSKSTRRALPVDQSTSRLSGRANEWRTTVPTESHLTNPAEIRFAQRFPSATSDVNFHRLPSPEDAWRSGTAAGSGEGFPGNGGFNSADLDGNASGLRESGSLPGEPEAVDSLRTNSRSGDSIGGGEGHSNSLPSQGNAISSSRGGAENAGPRLREVEEIPGRVIQRSPQPTRSSPSGASPGSSTSPSLDTPSPAPALSDGTSPSSSGRSFRPVVPPGAAGGVAAIGAAGGASSGGTPVVTGSSVPPTPESTSDPRGPITPLPPASIPEASIGSGGGGSAPASGSVSNPPVPAASSMGYTPPVGGSNSAAPPSAPSGAPGGFTPVPAAVPPQAVGGFAGIPVVAGIPGGGFGSGVGGGGSPSGGGASSPSLTSGSSGNGPASPRGNTSPPSASGAPYSPPGTQNTPAAGPGSSPGGSPSSTNSLSPALPLVPVVPASGAVAAGGGSTGGAAGALPAPLPSTDLTQEDPENAEPDDDPDLPTQCIPWVVQEGQNLQSLATSVGTTPETILKVNKTTSIFPGQVIRLPVRVIVPCCE